MQAKTSNLEWVVKRRSDIQALSLLILTNLEGRKFSDLEDDKHAAAAALLVGAAFSLWRGVFLSHEDLGRKRNLEIALEYLRKVVEENTVTFSDDRAKRSWIFAYYANNARFRLHHLCHYLDNFKNELDGKGLWPVISQSTPMKRSSHLWDDLYNALLLAFNIFKRTFDKAGEHY